MANIASAILVLLVAAPVAYAATQTVGGNSGWNNMGSNYDDWASGITFNVGDSLVFNYGTSTHSVAEVLKSDYDSCSSSNALKTYSDGATTIPLTQTGTRYFICPTLGHCNSGMKLAVNVVAAGGTPTTPTTPATPSPTTPSTPSTPSDTQPTTPSTTPETKSDTPPPAPKPSGAASIVCNMIVGVLFVLGTTVALMG